MSEQQATFAGYELEQRIMVDPASFVFRARRMRDLTTTDRGVTSRVSRTVLLRVSEPIEDGAERWVPAFVQRVRDASEVSHRGLARIVDGGQADDRVYVANDWTDGLTLEAQIERAGRLDPSVACDLLLPVAEALDALHATGVAHGAVSPRTIWLDDVGDGTARLTGLGLDMPLYVAEDDGRDALVHDGMYVAPEQVQGQPSQGAVDRYALACTLFHCIAGRPPFRSTSAVPQFGAQVAARLPRVERGGREVSRDLQRTIAITMDADPARRHATCVELIRAAQDIVGPPLPTMPGGASEPADTATTATAGTATARAAGPPTADDDGADHTATPGGDDRPAAGAGAQPGGGTPTGVGLGWTVLTLLVVIVAAVALFFALAFGGVGALLGE